MSQNKNIPCFFENSISSYGFQQNIGMSVFNFQQNTDSLLELNKEIRKNSFSAFINSRNQYLTRLTNIGDNWISGSSRQPTDKSIDLSKDLINNLGYWYLNEGYKKHIYPKLIMSPTPMGGIAMEVELFPKVRAYVTILDDEINFEVERDGFYSEQKVDKNNLSNILLTLYNTNERGDNS